MRSWVKAVLFLSSFSPLFFILFVQNINFDRLVQLGWIDGMIALYELDQFFAINSWVAAVFLALFVAPNGLLFALIYKAKRSTPITRTVSATSTRNNDVLNYIATYLVPFLSFKADKISDLVAFAILIIILTIIYIQANMFFINPILILSGYRIAQINDNIIVITKSDLQTNSSLKLYLIEENVYVGVKA
jgi:hypothetical protein